MNSSSNTTNETRNLPTGFAQRFHGLPGTMQLNLQSVTVPQFANTCRICAAVVDRLTPIFEGEGLRLKLADKIHKHLPIEVEAVGALPRGMCAQCQATLLAWHELVQCCLQADGALRARLLVEQGRAGLEANLQNLEATLLDPNHPEIKDSHAGDSEPIEGASDHSLGDDEPLALPATPRAGRAYEAFYRALTRFRDHYVEEHEANRKYPEYTDSSSDTSPEEGPADAAGYDDLSRGLRRDRLDEATRAELAAARLPGRGYGCACGRRLASAHSYVLHRRIHTGERPCVCHVCGAQFRAPAALRRHVAETHERARRPACRTCLRTFANAHNLRQHQRTHTGERPYVCARCGKRFTQSGSLHAHLRTHSSLRPHACALCPAAFRLRAALVRHARRHRPPDSPDPPPHACAACPAAFRQRRALRHHARRAHAPPLAPPPALDASAYESPPLRRGCAYCDEAVSPEDLRTHLLDVHCDDVFLCDDCEAYVDRRDFIVHMSLHSLGYTILDVPGERPAPARLIELIRGSMVPSRVVKPEKRPVEPEPEAASTSGLEPKREKVDSPAARSSTLVAPPPAKETLAPPPTKETPAPPPARVTRAPPPAKEIPAPPPARETPPPKPPAPPIAPAVAEEDEFSDRSDREFEPLPESVFRAIEDSQEDRAEPEPEVEGAARRSRRQRRCPQCAKVYTAASSYFYHVKHAHSTRREHACPQCAASFASRAGLAQHAAVHAAARRHACARCGAAFRSRGALYVHEQTHGAAKRHECGACGRAFRWQAALARHAARHAPAPAHAHACARCGRRFAVRADLLRHARTHEPQPSRCPHCARAFAQPRYLRVHVQRKHPPQREPAATPR